MIMKMRVAELWRYPVKSLAGERLNVAEISADGIPGDRVVQVYDADGRIVTARTAEHVVENERGVERAVRAVHVEFDRGVAGRVQADERRRGSGRNRVVEPTGHEHDAALAELFVEPGGVLPSAGALRHGSSRVRGPFDHPAPRYPSGAKLVASITALMSPWARQVGL
jgi:hypothetical protein